RVAGSCGALTGSLNQCGETDGLSRFALRQTSAEHIDPNGLLRAEVVASVSPGNRETRLLSAPRAKIAHNGLSELGRGGDRFGIESCPSTAVPIAPNSLPFHSRLAIDNGSGEDSTVTLEIKGQNWDGKPTREVNRDGTGTSKQIDEPTRVSCFLAQQFAESVLQHHSFGTHVFHAFIGCSNS